MSKKGSWEHVLEIVQYRLEQCKEAEEKGIFLEGDLVKLKNDSESHLYQVIKIKEKDQTIRLLNFKRNHGETYKIEEVVLVGRPLFLD